MATPIPPNDARFTAWELAAITRGDLVQIPDERASVAGLFTDSRAVVSGSGFVAIRGEKLDGHAFVPEAVARGASVVVVERGAALPAGVAAVAVDSSVAALGRLGAAHLDRWRRERPSARVVAITGSAGKTTTKELVAAILGAVGPTHFTTGNLNNRIGRPAVALGLRFDAEHAVFELGMSSPGEIADLTGIVAPDVAVLLNVGLAHAAEFGGSRARIAREKGEIFEALSSGAVAVANADDPAAAAQVTRTKARPVYFGSTAGADVRVVHRELGRLGTSKVIIERKGTGGAVERLELVLPVQGDAAATDLAAAIAAADATVGRPIPREVVAAAVLAWKPPPGRAETLELVGDVWVLDDSYNANPASMRAAFTALAELRSAGRRRAICVLGEMRELGSISAAEHESLGDELVRHGFDLVIGCGGEIDLALSRAERGGLDVRRAKDAGEAGRELTERVKAGDVVLFKGSRGAAVERALAVLEERHPRAARVTATKSAEA
jgi:UDP-N-acetylmuramoyl-tripeptide--D-alanyl-D-alanine ligase